MPVALRNNIEKTLGTSIREEDFQVFSALMFEKTFDKKDMLTEEGNACNYTYFITEGSCYSYITDDKGEKHVVQFALEGY